MRTFLAAVSMLSALPLGRFCPTETELQRSQNLFPAAGLLFGVLLGCAAWGLVYLQLPLLPTAMLLALLLVMTASLKGGAFAGAAAGTAFGLAMDAAAGERGGFAATWVERRA